jgi:hypothetical protein
MHDHRDRMQLLAHRAVAGEREKKLSVVVPRQGPFSIAGHGVIDGYTRRYAHTLSALCSRFCTASGCVIHPQGRLRHGHCGGLQSPLLGRLSRADAGISLVYINITL